MRSLGLVMHHGQWDLPGSVVNRACRVRKEKKEKKKKKKKKQKKNGGP